MTICEKPAQVGFAPVTCTLHNHCTFCDGEDTPASMADAAKEAGFAGFGFSCHSAAPYPPYTGVGDAQAEDYLHTIRVLRRRYEGEMRLWAGIEQDFYAPISADFRSRLDYLIGAVHDLCDPRTGEYYWVDGSPAKLRACIEEMFDGDAMAMVRHFYALTAENAEIYKPDIIAHFDLVTKNNANNGFFDEESPAYKAAALEAMECCAATGAVFEVNTGGMYRGYRNRPYPARFLLEAIRDIGARITLSADAHSMGGVNYAFPQTLALLREVGFESIAVWQDDGFVQKVL